MLAVEAMKTRGQRLWNRHFWVVAHQCNRGQKHLFRVRVLTFFSTYYSYSYSHIVDPNYLALFDIRQIFTIRTSLIILLQRPIQLIKSIHVSNRQALPIIRLSVFLLIQLFLLAFIENTRWLRSLITLFLLQNHCISHKDWCWSDSLHFPCQLCSLLLKLLIKYCKLLH